MIHKNILYLLSFHIAMDSNSWKEIAHVHQSFNIFCFKFVDLALAG